MCEASPGSPVKRTTSDASTAEPSPAEMQTKRMRQCLDETAEALVCPITSELPVDPVTAEDGRVYERRAIEEWIARPENADGPSSPTTHEPMGPKLLPAQQTRSLIDRMVRSGVLSGPKADAWARKLEETCADQQVADAREVEMERERAREGNVRSMLCLGFWYMDGMKGLPRDRKEALRWYTRGHGLGGVACTTNLGACYLNGEGVEKDEARAMHLYSVAAGRGDECACFQLGWSFADGLNGLPRDHREATLWFRAMGGAEVRDAPQSLRDKAARWLREHAAEPDP